MFAISDQWLREHSRAEAWTADQLRCIGIEWPPTRGWKRRVIRRTITDQQKARFEQAMRAKAARQATADSATLDLFREHTGSRRGGRVSL
jgi:hypothetical protein